MNKIVYDLLVIGGGSGGIPCAKRAAQHGARVLLVEKLKLGGTCVNVGCVPKKVMWNAAHVLEVVRDSHQFGVFADVGDNHTTALAKSNTFCALHDLKQRRDKYVARLNGLYMTGLRASPKSLPNRDGVHPQHCYAVEVLSGTATILEHTQHYFTVEIVLNSTEKVVNSTDTIRVECKRVLLATGGRPSGLVIPGADLAIDSDGFFSLSELPPKVAIIGAGYIAVEIAGVLNALGSETHLFLRFDKPLRRMDSMLGDALLTALRHAGVHVHQHATPESIVSSDGLHKTLTVSDGRKFIGFSHVIAAIGRVPNVEHLGLESLNVQCIANPNKNCAPHCVINHTIHNAMDTTVNTTMDNTMDSTMDNTMDSTVDSTKHTAIHNTIHSTKHTAIQNTIHSTEHSTVHNTIHSTIHSTKHTPIHNTKNTPIHSTKDTPIHGIKHNTNVNDNYYFGCHKFSVAYVKVDEYQNTTVPNLYALGDVCGRVELTPMAIAAGRKLADRLFGGYSAAKTDYELVPTVVFSHPPLATVGLSEEEALELYGKDVEVFNNSCVNLFYGQFAVEANEKPVTRMKLVCLRSQRNKVLGLHIFGMGADEMMQGFAVAIKMGATKADFDKCIAIHPTASEEIVTMQPWGMH